MKNDRGKRVFIVLLAAALVALYVYSGTGRYAASTDEEEGHRNTSLYVRTLDDGTIYFGGEGKVYGDEFETLLSESRLHTKDVVNVVFGDGITEIGYNVMNRYGSLETVRLGAGTKVVNNGAISRCDSLQYIYVPKGIQRVSRGFLYNCPNAYVVTDAAEGELIKLENAKANRVITEVRSYEDLPARREALKYLDYASNALYSNDPDSGVNPMVVNPGCVQYGPFVSMNAGAYTVKLWGRGCEGIPEAWFDIYAEGVTFEKQNTVITDECVTYDVVFPEKTEKVEFRALNQGDVPFEVERLEVYDNNYELPAVLAHWWELN